MGDGDPKCKCKKVSRTKMELNSSRTKIPAELKIAAELKFGGDPWVMGTLRECKKVPVELKLKVPVELKLKVPAELKLKVPAELKLKVPVELKA